MDNIPAKEPRSTIESLSLVQAREHPKIIEFARKICKWESGDWEFQQNDYCDIVCNLLDEHNLDGYHLAKECDRYHHMDPDAGLVEILDGAANIKYEIVKELVKQWVQRNNLVIPDTLLDTQVMWRRPNKSLSTEPGWVVALRHETYDVTINPTQPRDQEKIFQTGYIIHVEDLLVPVS